jgi:hypothetical protein
MFGKITISSASGKDKILAASLLILGINPCPELGLLRGFSENSISPSKLI